MKVLVDTDKPEDLYMLAETLSTNPRFVSIWELTKQPGGLRKGWEDQPSLADLIASPTANSISQSTVDLYCKPPSTSRKVIGRQVKHHFLHNPANKWVRTPEFLEENHEKTTFSRIYVQRRFGEIISPSVNIAALHRDTGKIRFGNGAWAVVFGTTKKEKMTYQMGSEWILLTRPGSGTMVAPDSMVLVLDEELKPIRRNRRK